jgi:replicative DNA helicase
MKAILRGLVYLEQKEKTEANENYKAVRGDRLTNLRKAEEQVLEYCLGFYTQYGEAPQHATALKEFEDTNATEEVVLLEEVAQETLVSGASYQAEFEKEVEAQASAALITVMRTAQKIATQGDKVKGTTLKGTDAAVAYLFSEVREAPKDQSGRMSASMKQSGQGLSDLYQERKANPAKTYGILTGYGVIDSATAGIRKKQLYIIAGFGGHLKTTWALNHMLNAVVEGGWNEDFFSSEMPAEDLKMMMVAMHSAHPRFHGIGRPIPSFRYLSMTRRISRLWVASFKRSPKITWRKRSTERGLIMSPDYPLTPDTEG